MNEDINNFINNRKAEILSVLEKIVNMDSASDYKKGADVTGDFLSQKFLEIGLEIEKVPQKYYGSHIVCRLKGKGDNTLIIGHFDTALPQGSPELRPFKIIGNKGYGCGVADMKAGIIATLYALKSILETTKLKPNITILLNSDEEPGSPTSREIIFKKALKATRAFIMEPGRNNSIVTQRKGVGIFTFTTKGVAAHAGSAPQLGRSALDAVELMDVGANYLREHIDEKARIHYSITNGGKAPNIVPAEASVWYYVRAPKRAMVEEIYERLIQVAKGAAMMTGTKVDIEFLIGCYDVLPNEILGDVMYNNMLEAGPPRYSVEDSEFAKELTRSFAPGQKEKIGKTYFAPDEIIKITLHEDIGKIDDKKKIMAGSMDGGDVSWIVPFAQITAAAYPVGTAPHSWQATASSGSGIGCSAMLFAAKTIAGSLCDLFTDDGTILKNAREEFEKKTKNNKYVSPLPEGLKIPVR